MVSIWSTVFLISMFVYSVAPTDLKLAKLAKALQPGAGYDDCPLCDSSVYSYCNHKLVHDACCCGAQTGYGLAPSCQYSDCRYLFANSCYEHSLILRCCCENPYKK